MNSLGTKVPEAFKFFTSLPTRFVGRTVASDQKVTKMKSSLTVKGKYSFFEVFHFFEGVFFFLFYSVSFPPSSKKLENEDNYAQSFRNARYTAASIPATPMTSSCVALCTTPIQANHPVGSLRGLFPVEVEG